ncbi:hypothetical protein NEOLEDRAFT_1129963, partial [Neolentinus lepideus HHB14362 ss-1]
MQHGYRGNASIGLKKWMRSDTLLFILPLPTIHESLWCLIPLCRNSRRVSSMQRPVFTGIVLDM